MKGPASPQYLAFDQRLAVANHGYYIAFFLICQDLLFIFSYFVKKCKKLQNMTLFLAIYPKQPQENDRAAESDLTFATLCFIMNIRKQTV